MNWLFLKGTIFMVFVIVSWVGSSLVIKLSLSEKDQGEAESFDKPLFISYTAWSSYTVYVLRMLYLFVIKFKCKSRSVEAQQISRVELKTALFAFPIFFTSITLYYFCLSKTSVSSTIIIGNTSSVFVFLFSLCLLNEIFSCLKLIAMIAWAGGVVLIAYADNQSSEGRNQILGDILGIISAMLLGLYSILLVKLIPIEMEEKVSFFNILGLLGLFCMITFWPLLLIFHYTGLETLELPTGKVYLYLAINIIFGTLLYGYWWARATLLLGPLLSNTSVIFVVPLSMLIDSFFQDVTFNWMYYLGTAGIVAGFLLVAIKNYKDSVKENSELSQSDKPSFLDLNASREAYTSTMLSEDDRKSVIEDQSYISEKL